MEAANRFGLFGCEGRRQGERLGAGAAGCGVVPKTTRSAPDTMLCSV